MKRKITDAFRNLISVPLYTFLSLISFPAVHAQEIKITFHISDPKDEPVPFANIRVINIADTLKIQKKQADKSGKADFILLKDARYRVRVTAVNYELLEKEIFISGTQPTFAFTIQPAVKTLSAVEVRATKPLMRQEDDKTIVDPGVIAASSTNAYEIIEKTPGLYVDQDGNIYLNSTTPATVYINGREMKMSAADIATLLKNLPPHSIKQIEILRTPSAKYDASGSGGIVNVVLKKGVNLGITGSINTGMNQGKYGNQFAGININNNNDKINSYLNLQHNRRNSYERINTDRNFAPDSLLSQDALTQYPGHSYFTGYGITYQLNKKWETEYEGRINLNYFSNNTTNENIIKKISSGSFITQNVNSGRNKGNSVTVNQSVSAKYKIDTLESEWETDFSYTYSENNSRQFFNVFYTVPAWDTSGGDGVIGNNRDFLNFRSDLRLKLPKKLTLETGGKSTLLLYKSATEYFREYNGIRNKDKYRTNSYRYRENINAAYLQASKTWGDIILKSGVRMENTNMKGRQYIPGDTSFTIHRTDFFPYIYLSKNVMKIAGYNLRAYLVFRRTLNRPGYEQLNPFPRYVDEFLSEAGNPALRPQFNKNYEANISVDEKPILAVGYNHTTDIFTNVIYQLTDTTRSLAYRTFDNVGTRKEVYFRGLGAIPPGKKYFFVIGTQYNHNYYRGLYEKQPLSFKRGSWAFFTYQTLKLDKRSQFSIHGFVRLNSQLQFYELSTFGTLNASINRMFFKQKLTITISVNDMFYTNKNDFSISQGTVNATGHRQADTRRFGLNVRYNFGIKKEEKKEFLNNVDSPEQ